MSQFSEQLRNFINDRDVKIYSLAAQSGVDRTLIQKMLIGERIPSNKLMVQKLASSLLLSPAETEILIESYYIAKMGEGTFSHRKFIRNFFNGFNNISAENDISVSTSYHHLINKLPNDATVCGNLQINNLVKIIIEMESMKKNGNVKIIAQPEYSFLFQCLSLVGMNKQDLSVDHIVCLENSTKDREKIYNLNCLNVIMPMLVAGFNYHPMCYYDHVSSHFSNTSMMCYMILTSDYVMNISYDVTYATISNAKPYLEICNQIFKSSVQKSAPMAKLLHSPVEHMECFTNVLSNFGHVNYRFTSDPSLICFATKKMLRKYMDASLPNKESLVETTMQYIGLLQKTLELSTMKAVYFSEEGLDKFLDTGRLTEVPWEYYSSIDIPDRYKLLRCMYDSALAGMYHPIIVKSAVLNIPANLSTVVYKGGAVSFVYTVPNHNYTAFVLNEKIMVYAVQDFFDCLAESNMVLSPEETLAIIKQKLENEPKDENIAEYMTPDESRNGSQPSILS